MDDEDILRTIREAAAEEAQIVPGLIQPEGNAETVPGWDSLAHTRIIMNIENRLGVELDMELTMGAATFKDLMNIIKDALK